MENGTVVVCEGDTYTVLQAVPHTTHTSRSAGAMKITMAPAAGGPSRVVICARDKTDAPVVRVAAPCETCDAPLGRACTGTVCLPRVPFNPVPYVHPSTLDTREEAHA